MIDLTVVVEVSLTTLILGTNIFKGKEFGAHRVVMAASSESFLPHGKCYIEFESEAILSA